MSETIIIETPATVETTEAETVQEQINEAIAEVQTDIEIKNEVQLLRGEIGNLNSKIDTLLARVSDVEANTANTHDLIEEVQTEVTEAILTNEELENIEEQIELEETIAQIDNDIQNDSDMITEVLDTNSVIDAIAPEIKKTERRWKFG